MDGHVDSRLAVPGAVVKGLVKSVPATAAVNRRSLDPMDGGKEGSLQGESAKEVRTYGCTSGFFPFNDDSPPRPDD
jgi:hypothetical protein